MNWTMDAIRAEIEYRRSDNAGKGVHLPRGTAVWRRRSRARGGRMPR